MEVSLDWTLVNLKQSAADLTADKKDSADKVKAATDRLIQRVLSQRPDDSDFDLTKLLVAADRRVAAAAAAKRSN